MKDNRGFTLVELIAVIAVMAIIAGVSTTVLSSVSHREMKNFLHAYDAMLSECKVETLSGMPSPSLKLVFEDKEYKAVLCDKNGNKIKEEYLGEYVLKCTVSGTAYTFQKNDTSKTLLTVRYDRNTGALTATHPDGTNISNKFEISVANKKGVTYSIELIPQTGYHKILP